jgi:hypothetical protein
MQYRQSSKRITEIGWLVVALSDDVHGQQTVFRANKNCLLNVVTLSSTVPEVFFLIP